MKAKTDSRSLAIFQAAQRRNDEWSDIRRRYYEAGDALHSLVADLEAECEAASQDGFLGEAGYLRSELKDARRALDAFQKLRIGHVL